MLRFFQNPLWRSYSISCLLIKQRILVLINISITLEKTGKKKLVKGKREIVVVD